jgi:hypothetical protein
LLLKLFSASGSRRKGTTVGKQRGRASGMKEDDTLTLLEMSLPDEIDQPGHAFARVDGMAKNAFVFGRV